MLHKNSDDKYYSLSLFSPCIAWKSIPFNLETILYFVQQKPTSSNPRIIIRRVNIFAIFKIQQVTLKNRNILMLFDPLADAPITKHIIIVYPSANNHENAELIKNSFSIVVSNGLNKSRVVEGKYLLQNTFIMKQYYPIIINENNYVITE